IWAAVLVPSVMSCDQLWLHSVCPSATMRRTSAARSCTWRPIRQNVALTPAALSWSRKWLVNVHCPSSDVSAAAFEPVVVMTDAFAGLTAGGFGDGFAERLAEGETDGATDDSADGPATGWVDGDEGRSAPTTAMTRITANPAVAAVRRADRV